MYTVMNPKRQQRVINLPTRTLYLPGRGRAVLTEAEFNCTEVQALLREGFLKVEG
jgi:hypothetical protein